MNQQTKAVGEVKITGPIAAHTAGANFRVDGQATVTGVSVRSISRGRGDDARAAHPADDAIAAVRNEQVAGGVHRQTVRLVQVGFVF